jgi:hypothetical protein
LYLKLSIHKLKDWGNMQIKDLMADTSPYLKVCNAVFYSKSATLSANQLAGLVAPAPIYCRLTLQTGTAREHVRGAASPPCFAISQF